MLCGISMFAKLSCALSLFWQEAVFCLKGMFKQMEGVTILVSQSFIYLHILFIFMCLFVM